MRALRNFKPDRCYHLISRIANRAFFLNDEKKTRFVERLWRVATFSGVEVLAYCFMSNHFHILVYVPDARELSDDELLVRIRALYSGTALALAEIEKEWELLGKIGGVNGRGHFLNLSFSFFTRFRHRDKSPVTSGSLRITLFRRSLRLKPA